MSEQKKQINMSIDNGTEFFAHELSINFSPAQFIFDFRSVTPRQDPRTREVPLVHMKHNIIMVDPFHAKRILEVLTNVVGKYEKNFGKIEKPKAMQKHEKNMKKLATSMPKETKESMPNYFG